MKKSLLLGALFASLALSVQAQTRFSIHEEFTGENCGPCAGTNPGFWRLCDSGTNPSKMIHIAHMVPIPSSGWFYMQTQTISDARAAYYTVPFAPYGRLNGQIPYASASTSSPGHPVYFTQAEIDSAARIPSPFNITVSNSWNANYDSVVTTVTITCVTNWTGTGVYLRAALVQNVLFSTPPGSNGEYDYRNIVRAMYPNATGTSLAGTWTTGMAQTLTITGAVPNFVQKEKSPFMVVWIQNDADKKIAQAAKATPLPLVPNDAAIDSIVPIGMICSNPGNYITGHTIRLHNVGSNAITSATIYYKKDGAASFNTYNWTGSLALGASAMVTLPNDTFVVGANPAYHSFYDSVANVNGTTDKNLPNNTNGDYFFIETNTALSMPYTTSFESADLGKFYYTDVNNNNKTWGAFQATSGSLGHTGTVAEKFDCYNFIAGESEVLTLPKVTTSSPSALDFYVAYKRYDNTSDDKLEVVYSTDCGANWTSIWSKSGTTLETVTPPATGSFTPSAASYKLKSVDVSSVPAGAILGFRGTSDYGNNIWIDDINLRAGTPAAISNVNEATARDISVYPNPAHTEATLSFEMSNAGEANVYVADQLGRVVTTISTGNLTAGTHTFTIATASLAAGIYHVVVNTSTATNTLQLSVVK